MHGCREAAQWVIVSYRVVAVLAVMGALSSCGLDASSGVRVADAVDASSDADDPDDASGVRPRAGVIDGADGATSPPGADGTPAGSGTSNGSAIGATSILPASVAVVGDSLALSASDEITAAFADLGVNVVAIDAVESRRMSKGGGDLPPGTAAIGDIVDAGELPELWVIALGTNDVGAQASSETLRDDVASVLREIPAGSPVIWVDIWIRDRSDAAIEANEAIRSVLAVRPHSFVADWHAWGAVPDTITGDGIHLTDIGQQRFATVIARAVELPGE